MVWADIDIITSRVTIIKHGKSIGSGRFRNETLSQEIMRAMIGYKKMKAFQGVLITEFGIGMVKGSIMTLSRRFILISHIQ